jgi:hypothetical protein
MLRAASAAATVNKNYEPETTEQPISHNYVEAQGKQSLLSCAPIQSRVIAEM